MITDSNKCGLHVTLCFCMCGVHGKRILKVHIPLFHFKYSRSQAKCGSYNGLTCRCGCGQNPNRKPNPHCKHKLNPKATLILSIARSAIHNLPESLTRHRGPKQCPTDEETERNGEWASKDMSSTFVPCREFHVQHDFSALKHNHKSKPTNQPCNRPTSTRLICSAPPTTYGRTIDWGSTALSAQNRAISCLWKVRCS